VLVFSFGTRFPSRFLFSAPVSAFPLPRETELVRLSRPRRGLTLSCHAVGNQISPPLRVPVFDRPPYTFKNEDGVWSGVAIELWEQIARPLNIPFVSMFRWRKFVRHSRKAK
jgi:Bacterial extracellular solute-binding proteins, family 3